MISGFFPLFNIPEQCQKKMVLSGKSPNFFLGAGCRWGQPEQLQFFSCVLGMRVKQAQSLGKVSNDAKQQMRMHVLSGLTEYMGSEGVINEFWGFEKTLFVYTELRKCTSKYIYLGKIDLLVYFLTSYVYKQSCFKSPKFLNYPLQVPI